MSVDTYTATSHATAQLPQVMEPRNAGMPLDLNWVLSAQANTSAIERRAASLPARRSVKKAHQAAWLLKAVTCIDLTTLSGDDTARRVGRLCAKARQPIATRTHRGLDDGLCVESFATVSGRSERAGSDHLHAGIGTGHARFLAFGREPSRLDVLWPVYLVRSVRKYRARSILAGDMVIFLYARGRVKVRRSSRQSHEC